MIWERNGDSHTATVERSDGQVRYRLAVDRLCARTWDWTVWQPGQSAKLIHDGLG
jgi:hypothetical protein